MYSNIKLGKWLQKVIGRIITLHYDCQKCLNYSALTNCRLDWCIRETYVELLEDFQKGKINTSKFCLAFENTGKLTSDIIDIFESNFIREAG